MPVAGDADPTSDAQAVRLKPVDHADVTIVVDNYVDVLMAGSESVHRYLATDFSRPRPTGRRARILGAGHASRCDGRRSSVLYDAGLTPDGLARNLDMLEGPGQGPARDRDLARSRRSPRRAEGLFAPARPAAAAARHPSRGLARAQGRLPDRQESVCRRRAVSDLEAEGSRWSRSGPDAAARRRASSSPVRSSGRPASSRDSHPLRARGPEAGSPIR